MKRVLALLALLASPALGQISSGRVDQGEQGFSATSPWYINLRNASGTELGVAAAPLRIDPTGTTTQPISAVSLPLPTGAATSANQSTEITALQIIDNVAHANDSALNNGVPIMGQLDDVSTGTVTENNVSTVRITPERRLRVETRETSDGRPKTYSAAVIDAATGLLATDIFTITGSATKTIRVLEIVVSGTRSTAAETDVLVLKRSTANSGGTSTTPTAVPNDSNDAAATATVRSYTANPTTGTLVGVVRSVSIDLAATNLNSGSSSIHVWDFRHVGQPPTLRGTSEVLAVNLNGVTITGSSLDISIEWTEE